ncbi:MAG: hypothetical protein II681_04095 [Bacteroidaceae bacterium]|nr:hypothetical protein [Bacteroidaceae bacterium]MBQ2460568.1 hypothetical protein [Bacteroidaceae bacterium]MBQ2595500.1 hypothetical protein [Bacteroidaceae bacterium]MBQ3958021.1 hypothetical protein [Bacteroidaceae bacterium]MBQ3991623.1 hypothetical protein [Bacteroidaceae bacterium]
MNCAKKLSFCVAATLFSLSLSAQKFVKASFVDGTLPDGDEGARMVTDGMKSTKWCIDAPARLPYFVILEAAEPIALKEYTLVTGNDTHSYPDRNPSTWFVYGSNDKTSWKLLDERHSNFRMADLNAQEYFFSAQGKTPCRYFKFVFSEMQADTRLQLSEIGLVK